MVLNMLCMWLLIGLWTGPGLSHLIFGFWNFVFILFEKVVEMKEKKTRTLFRCLYVMIVAIVSVIALNAGGLYQFTLYISNLFGMKGYGVYSNFAMQLLKEYWFVILAGIISACPTGTTLRKMSAEKAGVFNIIYAVCYPIVMAGLVALVVFQLSGIHYEPAQMLRTFLWR